MTILAKLLFAIVLVETGNHAVINRHDHGVAIGPMQIHRCFWLDSRVPGRWRDCMSLAYSERVAVAYWRRYVPLALRRRDAEVLARTFNGGPRGADNPRTLGYWFRVKRVLQRKEK